MDIFMSQGTKVLRHDVTNVAWKASIFITLCGSKSNSNSVIFLNYPVNEAVPTHKSLRKHGSLMRVLTITHPLANYGLCALAKRMHLP